MAIQLFALLLATEAIMLLVVRWVKGSPRLQTRSDHRHRSDPGIALAALRSWHPPGAHV